MARNLVRASTQYLLSAGNPPVASISGQRLSVAGWVNLASGGIDQFPWDAGNVDSGGEALAIWINSSNFPQVVSRTGTANQVTTGSGGLGFNVWVHLGVYFDGVAGEQAIYLSGGGKVTGSMFLPGGLTYTQLGNRAGLTMNGRQAEWAMWNVKLSDDEFAELAKGFSPLVIRPQSLLAYWPLYGQASPEPDLRGTFPMALVNAPTAFDHPRIYAPERARVFPSAEPPAAPTYISPVNGAAGQSVSVVLSWNPVLGATGYDVYVGTVNPPVTLVSANQPGTTYAVSLAPSAIYYWKIVARNGGGSATGAIWSFTTASGNPLLTFEATAARLPLTNAAAFSTRNGHPVLAFDDTVAESAHFSSILPRHYTGGGLVAQIAWTAVAVSGAAIWSIAIERHDPTTDLDADSFATGVSAAAATTNATSGAPTYTTIALTTAQIDGLLLGEHFRLKVTRATGGLVGDAELWALDLRET